MSLYLIELKIKTALELVQNIDDRHNAVVSADSWTAEMAAKNHEQTNHDISALRGVLREIINRPKEEDRG